MEKQILLDKLQSLVQRAVLVDEPMSKHTTWKIGGPADYYVRPSSKAELAALLKLIHQEGLPFIVIGNGSNLLVGDKGIRGVVIKMSGSYSRRIWREEGVEAQAGAMLPTLAIEAAERAFCGMEFAAGIPGSIGGAVRMNAGAYGNNIGDDVTQVEAIVYNGTIKIISAEDLSFAYRESNLFDLEAIVSSVTLRLPSGNREQSLEKIQELLRLRSLKQPLEFPSCGSVFRNPANDHAGRLVEIAGLRGMQIGGAAVSKKHGNFIVNVGGARARDVRALIADVQKRVEDFSGIHLEPEVKFVGEF